MSAKRYSDGVIRLDDGREIRVGSRIASRYLLKEALGSGGMAVVYRARDDTLEIDLALKLLLPELARNRDSVLRFRHELLLARRVSHRHVVRIYDIGEHQGICFMTMDLISGGSLQDLLGRRGRLSHAEAMRFALQIGAALNEAHRRNIVHCDLKPGNVLLDEAGDAYVSDFGVARFLDESPVTPAAQAAGTPAYASPEQARSERLDARSDIYSLGLLIFEMLAGDLPFERGDPLAVLADRALATPRTFEDLRVEVPELTSRIVWRALQRQRARRYQNLDELLVDLEQAARIDAGGHAAARETKGYRFSVRTFQAALAALERDRPTGVLTCQSGLHERRLFVEAGIVVAAVSTHPTETFGQFLLSKGLIGEEELREALVLQESCGGYLGSVLRSLGALGEEQILQALKDKTRRIVFGLFDLENVQFQFTGGSTVELPFRMRLELAEIVAEGEHRVGLLESIRETLPDPDAILARTTATALPAALAEDPAVRVVYDLVDGRRSMAEIRLAARASGYSCSRALLELQEAGLVDVMAVSGGGRQEPAAVRQPIADVMLRARALLAQGDCAEARRLLRGRLEEHGDDRELMDLFLEAEHRFLAYAYSLLPKSSVLEPGRDSEEWLQADFTPEEVFVLSRVDGLWDVKSIVKVAPLREGDAMQALIRLLKSGAVRIASPFREVVEMTASGRLSRAVVRRRSP